MRKNRLIAAGILLAGAMTLSACGSILPASNSANTNSDSAGASVSVSTDSSVSAGENQAENTEDSAQAEADQTESDSDVQADIAVPGTENASSTQTSSGEELQNSTVILPTVPAGDDGSVITVTQSHIIQVQPDVASIRLTIETGDADADTAQRQNEQVAESVIEALQDAGVYPDSIVTSDYTIYPNYSDRYVNGRYDIVSYNVSTELTVSDLAVEDVGSIISTAVKAGATGIHDVSFTYSDYDATYEEALSEAVRESVRKAQAIADAQGAELTGILSVKDGWQDTSARYNNTSLNYDTDFAAKDEAADTYSMAEPKALEIRAEVTVDYKVVR